MDTEAMALEGSTYERIDLWIMHLNFNQFSYGFVLGVILCAVVEAWEVFMHPWQFIF